MSHDPTILSSLNSFQQWLKGFPRNFANVIFGCLAVIKVEKKLTKVASDGEKGIQIFHTKRLETLWRSG